MRKDWSTSWTVLNTWFWRISKPFSVSWLMIKANTKLETFSLRHTPLFCQSSKRQAKSLKRKNPATKDREVIPLPSTCKLLETEEKALTLPVQLLWYMESNPQTSASCGTKILLKVKFKHWNHLEIWSSMRSRMKRFLKRFKRRMIKSLD